MAQVSRVAVVTGGGSGMGRAICHHLGRQGRQVAVLDINGEAARRGGQGARRGRRPRTGVRVDVSDRAAIDAAFDEVRRELGPIEILVTSAGIEGFERLPRHHHRAVGPHGGRQPVGDVPLPAGWPCPDMLEAGWGRIVTISSSSAQSGTRRMSHYVATKGGVIALTKALALDLAPHGITVNTIPPGVIDTPMMRRPVESGAMGSLDQIIARAPLGRLGTPDDIAVTTAFLCSEEAGYITGQQINVNGGWYV